MSKEKQKVVIVGGGFGGIALAKALDKDFEVTVVEKRKKAYHNLSSLRSVVDLEHAKKTFIPYDKVLKNGKVINEEVTAVEKDSVTLKSGDNLSFDYLVLAVGTSYPAPFKISNAEEEALEGIKTLHQKLLDAHKVLIVGIGPVGLELAGEIATYFPNKKVTMVGPALLPGNIPDKFREKVRPKVEKELHIKLITGERLLTEEKSEGNTYKTDKGTEIEADLVIHATGSSLNTEFLKPSFGDRLDSEGRVKVNHYLQVEGLSNVFAIGDITNIVEPKLAFVAGQHASLTAANIKALSNKKALKAWTPAKPVMFLLLGRNNGATLLPNGAVMGKTMVKMFKGKDLMLSKYWGDLGQKISK